MIACILTAIFAHSSYPPGTQNAGAAGKKKNQNLYPCQVLDHWSIYTFPFRLQMLLSLLLKSHVLCVRGVEFAYFKTS